MEVNTYLTKVTDCLFKKAHMLVYADMSSEEGINKWFENDKLKDLSLIKTWEDQNLSKKLFIAKNVLNKVFDINITNEELATILVESGENNFTQARNAFMDIVCKKLKGTHPAEYELLNNSKLKGEDISTTNFFTHTFRKTDVTVHNFDELIPSIGQLDFAPDIKVPLEEISDIAKETGGHIILAHPEVAFKPYDGATIKIDKFLHNGDTSIVSLNNVRLEDRIKLLVETCAKKGIKIEGIELTRKTIRDPKKLVDLLTFAKYNNLEVSFGSDVHYTPQAYGDELLNEPKTYKKIHFGFNEAKNKIDKNKKKNKKDKKKSKDESSGLGRKLIHEVNYVSMYDKIMGKKSNVLLEMTLNGKPFRYDKKKTKNDEETPNMGW